MPLPKHLATVPGSFLVKHEDGLLLHTGLHRRELHGPLAETIIEDVWKLLDGSRTTEEIYQVIQDVPKHFIEECLSTFAAWKLLLEEHDAKYLPHRTYLQQLMVRDAARGKFSEDLTYHSQALVYVIAESVLDEGVFALLSETLHAHNGLRCAVIATERLSELLPEERSLMLLLHDLPSPAALSQRVLRLMNYSKRPYLIAGCNAGLGVASIGPWGNEEGYVELGAACSSETKGNTSDSSLSLQVWSARLVAKIVDILSGFEDGQLYRSFQKINLQSGRVSWHELASSDLCGEWSAAFSAEVSDEAKSFLRFEESVAFSADGLSEVTAGEQAVQSALSEVSDYHCRIPLPFDAAAVSENLNLQSLSALLGGTGGFKEVGSHGGGKRWAPSAGNLGSTELYLLIGGIEGVPSGTYLYVAQNHELRQLHRWETLFEELPEGPFVVITFSGNSTRLTFKYRDFSYRLLHFDLGVTFVQCLQLISELKLTASRTTEVSPECFRYFYSVCADPSLSCLSIRVGNSSQLLPRMRPARREELKRVFEYLDSSPKRREGNLDALLSLGRSIDLHTWLEKPKEHFLSRLLRTWKGFADPTNAFEIISRRSSCRSFSERAIERGSFETALSAAINTAERFMPAGLLPPGSLGLRVLAHRVQSLHPGVYCWDRKTRSLKVAFEAEPNLRVDAALINELFINTVGSPAAVIWIHAHRPDLQNRINHQAVFIEAGALGNALWFETLRQGWDGCLVAGIVRSSATRILKLKAYAELSCLAFICGYREQQQGIAQSS